MLNINLKIEAKNCYVINDKLFFFSDMPRSKELNLIYEVFEDSFLVKYKLIKSSKKLKINTDINIHMSKRQNELRLKISKLSDSKIYIDNKISLLNFPFPNENVCENKKRLNEHSERLNELILLFQNEIRAIYFK